MQNFQGSLPHYTGTRWASKTVGMKYIDTQLYRPEEVSHSAEAAVDFRQSISGQVEVL